MTKIRIQFEVEIDRDTIDFMKEKFNINGSFYNKEALIILSEIQNQFSELYLSSKQNALDKIITEIENLPSLSHYVEETLNHAEKLLHDRKMIMNQIKSFKEQLEKDRKSLEPDDMDDDLPF